MVQQIEITLTPKRRGFHLVTSEILSQLPKLPKTGIVNIFTKHTSCGLSINEDCDPDVRVGIFIFHEPATFWRLFFITTLIASIVGLKTV